MKTQYNKAIGVALLLGAVGVVNAQEDLTKKNALEREMTLEREYDPTVLDANKVNTLPAIKEPEARKIPIDYSDYTIPASPAPQIGILPAGNMMTEIAHNKRRGYLNLGVGTYLNINGDVGYHILSTEKDKLNVWYSHRSTNGNVSYSQLDDVKVKAKINDNLGGVGYTHAFDKMLLNMGLRYGYSAFNYYGLPNGNSSSLPLEQQLEQVDRETNQVNQTIMANVGVESKEGADVGYLLDVDYIRFSHKYGLGKPAEGPAENTIDVKFGLNAGFNGNMRVGLDGQFEYFNYSLPEETKAANGTFYVCEFENHAEGTLSPYYRIEGDNWNVKLGASVMFVTGENSKFMASPNIAADVEVAEKTQFYLNAGGKLYSNSMYETSLVNRYVDPTCELAPSRNWLDAQLGLRSGIVPGFWFDIFGGYKITSSDVLFLPSRTYMSGHFGNFSQAMPDVDTKLLFAGVNLKYSYQQLFDIQLKGVYNHWTATYGDSWIGGEVNGDLEYVWGKPKVEITAGVTVHPIQKLAIALDYYLATDRYTELDGANPLKMNNINELNLTGSYTFNDTFGVYAKLNNILFQEYELYYGYPMQKFSAMVGVNINF